MDRLLILRNRMLSASATQAVMQSERQIQDTDRTRVVGNRLKNR